MYITFKDNLMFSFHHLPNLYNFNAIFFPFLFCQRPLIWLVSSVLCIVKSERHNTALCRITVQII